MHTAGARRGRDRAVTQALVTRSTGDRTGAVPTVLLQRTCACGSHEPAGGDECAECLEERSSLRRSAVQLSRTTAIAPAGSEIVRTRDHSPDSSEQATRASGFGHDFSDVRVFSQQEATAPPIVHDVLHLPGRSLEGQIRKEMEQRLGHDFGAVLLHTDALAARSAEAVRARAYTVGRHVVFAHGQYRPATPEGHQVLAHELVHVIQQRSAAPPTGALAMSRPTDPCEREADTVSGNGAQSASSRYPVTLARQPALPIRPPVRAPVRPPLRSIPGGRTEPGLGSVRAPERLYVPDPWDDSLDAMFARAELRARRERDIARAERPVATLDRGGAPPTFVTVDGTQEGMWEWGNAVYQVRSFHVLDAIEYDVSRARSDDDLRQVLENYVGYLPDPNLYMRTGRVRPFRFPSVLDIPRYPADFDPGGVERLRVYTQAVARRQGHVPGLAQARHAVRIPEKARRRGCLVEPRAPLGDDPVASLFCDVATGVGLEYRFTTPQGEWTQYDSLIGDIAFECKCGYQSVPDAYRRWLSTGEWRYRWAERRVDELEEQLGTKRRVADACGLQLVYVVSNSSVQQFLTERWSGNPPVVVHHFDPCDRNP